MLELTPLSHNAPGFENHGVSSLTETFFRVRISLNGQLKKEKWRRLRLHVSTRHRQQQSLLNQIVELFIGKCHLVAVLLIVNF